MKTGLQICAQLENLKHIKAIGEDFRWYLKLRCSNCGEETQEFVYCCLSESYPSAHGKSNASLNIKCKLCKRENSIDIIKESINSYTQDDAGQFKTIVVFDCRGATPVDFSPRVGWEAEGLESNAVFSDVDLKECEWYDYDDKAGESVSITELKYQFITVKT
ncbi:CXXC motif containing zinc binding protein-like [Physella acuta]|uniref:CXXC motif containing zinc binding protein-like n=1 Tax=Physella acuta TaxID=109671 RepID=UPI0027DE5B7C|nr:CXXC motif containing zinc binding protein-like [Physella acuta]